MDCVPKIDYVGPYETSFTPKTQQDLVSNTTLAAFKEEPLTTNLNLKNKNVKEILKFRVLESEKYLKQRDKALIIYGITTAGFFGVSATALTILLATIPLFPFWIDCLTNLASGSFCFLGTAVGITMGRDEYYKNLALAEELSDLKKAVKNLDNSSFVEFCELQEYENLEELLKIMEFHTYIKNCIKLKNILETISNDERVSKDDLEEIELIKKRQKKSVKKIEKITGVPFKRFEIETEEYMNV